MDRTTTNELSVNTQPLQKTYGSKGGAMDSKRMDLGQSQEVHTSVIDPTH